MSKEKIAPVYIDENKNVYELKKPVYKKPLFWSTILLSILSIFLVSIIYLAGIYANGIEEALKSNNVYYDQRDKQLHRLDTDGESPTPGNNIIETKTFGEKVIFDEGTIQVKGMELSEGKVTVAIVLENNTDRTSSFNPKDFIAKAGNERLRYYSLTEIVGLDGEEENKKVSPNSNAVFFLNYDVPKNNSTDYSMQIGQYLWK